MTSSILGTASGAARIQNDAARVLDPIRLEFEDFVVKDTGGVRDDTVTASTPEKPGVIPFEFLASTGEGRNVEVSLGTFYFPRGDHLQLVRRAQQKLLELAGSVDPKKNAKALFFGY